MVLDEIGDIDRREVVRKETEYLKRSVPYTAPEAMSERWRELAQTLLDCDRGGFIIAGERMKICAILRDSRDQRYR